MDSVLVDIRWDVSTTNIEGLLWVLNFRLTYNSRTRPRLYYNDELSCASTTSSSSPIALHPLSLSVEDHLNKSATTRKITLILRRKISTTPSLSFFNRILLG